MPHSTSKASPHVPTASSITLPRWPISNTTPNALWPPSSPRSFPMGCGTQYGFITTGGSFVFHVRVEENAKIVYYHLAEPNAGVTAQKKDFPSTEDYLRRTVISQALAFSVLALRSVQGSQEWREDIIKTLKKWEVDYSQGNSRNSQNCRQIVAVFDSISSTNIQPRRS